MIDYEKFDVAAVPRAESSPSICGEDAGIESDRVKGTRGSARGRGREGGPIDLAAG